MTTEVKFDISHTAAITDKNRIITHREHPPIELTVHLMHEFGHILQALNMFSRKRILNPRDIYTTTIDLNSARKRFFRDLYKSNSNQGVNWIPDVVELVWDVVAFLTKGNLDLTQVELYLADTKTEFIESISPLSFKRSGIDTNPGTTERVARLTREGHFVELPAYYLQQAGGSVIEQTLTSLFKSSPEIQLIEPQGSPSHAAAYKSAKELLEGGSFPTERKIKRIWHKRMREATSPIKSTSHFPDPVYLQDFAQTEHLGQQ